MTLSFRELPSWCLIQWKPFCYSKLSSCVASNITLMVTEKTKLGLSGGAALKVSRKHLTEGQSSVIVAPGATFHSDL